MLKACSKPALKTFDRNNDGDDNGSQIAIHKNVSIVSDKVESIFAASDHSARGGADFGAVRGDVIAKLTGALDSESQRRTAAEMWVKEHIKNGSITGDYDKLVKAKFEELSMQNYFNTENSLRMAVLKEVRKHYQVNLLFFILYFLLLDGVINSIPPVVNYHL